MVVTSGGPLIRGSTSPDPWIQRFRGPSAPQRPLHALTPFTHMVLGGTVPREVPHAQAMGVSLERPVVQIYFNHCGGGGG